MEQADKAPSSGVVGGFIFTVVAHVVALGALVVALVYEAPRHEAMFRDLQVALPAVTILAIRLSHLTKQYALLVVPPFLIVDAIIYLALRAGLRSKALGTLWSILVLLTIFGLAVAVVLALWLPMQSLMDNVQRPA